MNLIHIDPVVAVLALLAWVTAIKVYRGSYRPVVRPIPRRMGADRAINARGLILKNIGRGPAIAVCVVGPRIGPNGIQSDALLHTVDVIEPLGEPLGGGEETRIGRVEFGFALNTDSLKAGESYRLLYQDLTSRWHETSFTIEGTYVMKTRFHGPLGWFAKGRLPNVVRDQAQVVHDDD